MTASQDSHATSSVVKESVVRGHHVYKVAADSLHGRLLCALNGFQLEGDSVTGFRTGWGFRTLRRAPSAFEGTASRCVSLYIDSCANCVQKRKLFYCVQAKRGALFGNPSCSEPPSPTLRLSVLDIALATLVILGNCEV